MEPAVLAIYGTTNDIYIIESRVHTLRVKMFIFVALKDNFIYVPAVLPKHFPFSREYIVSMFKEKKQQNILNAKFIAHHTLPRIQLFRCCVCIRDQNALEHKCEPVCESAEIYTKTWPNTRLKKISVHF